MFEYFTNIKDDLTKKLKIPKNCGLTLKPLTKVEKYLLKYPPKPILKEYIPKHTRSTYKTNPKMSQIQHMSEEELKYVSNFSISNNFGMVEFLEPVDLTYCNLDLWIRIKKQQLIMFPEDAFEFKKDIPAKGTKINCKLIVTFFNIHTGNDLDTFVTKSKINKNMFESQTFSQKELISNFNKMGVDIKKGEHSLLSLEKNKNYFKYFSSNKKNNVIFDSIEKDKFKSNKKYFTSHKKRKPKGRYLDTPDNAKSMEFSEFSESDKKIKTKPINPENQFIKSLKKKKRKKWEDIITALML
jgi:hypothetical protein